MGAGRVPATAGVKLGPPRLVHERLTKVQTDQSILEILKLPETQSKSPHPFLFGAPRLKSKGMRTSRWTQNAIWERMSGVVI